MRISAPQRARRGSMRQCETSAAASPAATCSAETPIKNPTAAAAMGVNTALYKSLTFGVSALLLSSPRAERI